jgi:hypothetical protein
MAPYFPILMMKCWTVLWLDQMNRTYGPIIRWWLP